MIEDVNYYSQPPGKYSDSELQAILLMVVLAKVISYPFFVIIPSLNHMTTRRVTYAIFYC